MMEQPLHVGNNVVQLLMAFGAAWIIAVALKDVASASSLLPLYDRGGPGNRDNGISGVSA